MGAAARLFVRVSQRLRRSAPRLAQCWSGFWLGVLPRSAMAAIDEALYTLLSGYRSAEHNRKGLVGWEREPIEAHFTPGSRIMVLAAGGGREVVALRRLGFDAFGWESHPELVRAAQKLLAEEGHPGVIHEIARDSVPEGTEIYDGAILGWTMYTLIHGRLRRTELLSAVRQRLIPGGPLLLSFWTRESDDQRSIQVHRIAQPLRRLLRREFVQVGDDMLPNVVHRFTRGEIEEELRSSGFELLRFEVGGAGPHDSAWAVARRA